MRVSVQIGEKLPVGKTLGDAMAGVHGAARLADASLALDHHDRHRQPVLILGGRHQMAEYLFVLLGAASEIRDIGGQQARSQPLYRLDLYRLGRGLEAGIGGEDRVLELAEPFVRFDPQLVDHGLPGLPVGLESLGRAAGAVQSEHELFAQSFPQRESLDQLDELADQLMMPAQIELEAYAVFGHADALLIQPAGGQLHELAVYAG